MYVMLRAAKAAMVLGMMLAVWVVTVATAGASTSRVAAAGTVSSRWNQTNYNAAQSRANVTEQTLTRATASKIRHLRSVTAPPISGNGCFTGPAVVAPVLTGGSLYAVTSGRLSRYNAATGSIIWRHNPDPSFSTNYTTLGVAQGLVVVGEIGCDSVSDPNGFIQAFSAATGALVWSQPITPAGGALSQLVIFNGYVVAAGTSPGGGQPVSVHKLTTGALIWYRLPDQCAPGDVLVDAQVVVGYSCSATGAVRLVGNNLATGARIWRRSGNWQLQRGDTATTAGRHVFATNPSGSVVSLNPLTGQTQYALARASGVLAVSGSQAYASCGIAVCAYNSATGSRQWRVNAGSGALAAEAGGVLYLDNGFALNTATGHTLTGLWTPSATAAWLVIGDGRIAAVTASRVIDLYGLPGY
jgi:putative pyrroloquinoline-quinone binding quinoprotein